MKKKKNCWWRFIFIWTFLPYDGWSCSEHPARDTCFHSNLVH